MKGEGMKMPTYKIARVEKLIVALKDGDVSKLVRWEGLGYQEFCNAIDDYVNDESPERWRDLLTSIANMIENCAGEGKI
jgi:hypothetical protein